MPVAEWNDWWQVAFEYLLIRLAASAGLPLSWVENPEFMGLCHEFIPYAVIPSQKVLTCCLLPLSGEHGTAQCDGWSGLNNHHYIAFMVTISNKVYMLLYNHMIEVLRMLNAKWKVVVVGFTTDASGEACKACKMLTESHPHLICPDCHVC
ncbi:hypothetical protein BDN71DRAFT_1483007 [Pleurotus eryngii]|uniref:Transposase n=1 Tax=Pleurotus eryngii TaxID=5323 RepID=A0A9P5ZXQ2_PLEER|nr:hypothetical protein BDN71DRAFT_1483007 [Pleurotus eryngii]